MAIYVILATTPILLSFFFKNLNNDDRAKKRFLFLCGLIMFLLLALRSKDVGSDDSVNYYRMLKDAMASNSWSDYYREDFVEGGFQLFTYIISIFANDPQWIFVVSAVIYISSICYFLYNNSKDVALGLVMYICIELMQFQMQGMRQAIAMSICMFAYEFAKRKKIIPFAFLILLAMQFHRTAIVFAIVLILVSMPYNWKTMSIVGCFVAAIFAFSSQLNSLANEIFESDYHDAVEGGGYVATSIYILIIVLTFFANTQLKEANGDSKLLFVTILAASCYILRYFEARSAERVSFYFMFAITALLPNTLDCLLERDRKSMKVLIYVLILGLFVYRLNGSLFVPFKFFWQ